jgi:hypothetical protein
MIPRNIGEADGDEVAENPNNHPSLVALIGSNEAVELLGSSDDCSNSERRHLVRRAMNLLSDDDQKIINLSIEHGAGHSLDGHIRQARKRALDRLKARVAQLRTEDET